MMDKYSPVISHPNIVPESIEYLSISLITIAAVFLYRLLSYDVRRAWLKYGVRDTSHGTNAYFEKLYRIQMNTLEHIVFFLPSLWLCAVYFSISFATWFGAVWVLGRGWYAVGYLRHPERPPLGFHVAMIVSLALFATGAAGAIYQFPIHFFIPTLMNSSVNPLIH